MARHSGSLKLLLAGAMATAMTAPGFAGPLVTKVSSHREAPGITKHPKVDATDFYMFRSYESGRAGYVTLIANYLPVQATYGGPNFFSLDSDALYEFHVDSNGDAKEDFTFQFRFQNTLANNGTGLTLKVGGKDVAVPVLNLGGISAGNTSALNVIETYNVTMVTGDRRSGQRTMLPNAAGGTSFTKPVDNIGNKSIPDYPNYAKSHVSTLNLPDGSTGRVFVGQRKDSFVVALGETFDLVNTNPLGPVNGGIDSLADSNVTSIILELPIAFLTNKGANPILGGWTSASLRQATVRNPTPTYTKNTVDGGAWTQVSRLGSPLVNELVIGLKDKDAFNASHPSGDGQFATYVTNPTLPAILEILFKVPAPTFDPAKGREDLVAAFLTGVPTLNKPANVVGSEMLRLNTATPVTPKADQKPLGVIGGDAAGFPNGRRPGDDVVDIALRVVMGALLPVAQAPVGQAPLTDGAYVDSKFFEESFPYLKSPLAGSPSVAGTR